jgi:hypothetical protein
MNLVEAFKSGRPFRRIEHAKSNGVDYWVDPTNENWERGIALSWEEVGAEDWEIKDEQNKEGQ